MMNHHPLSGVYAASVTPLNPDQTIALQDIPEYLSFLASRGCHGALLLGTTGEGPSFAAEERIAIFKAGLRVREAHPDFRLLAGTGDPSLEETIYLTKSAFDLGFNGAVVLPPYYFHQATSDGLFSWFQELIRRSMPQDGALLGYHFPAQSGVPIPLNVLSRLRAAYPNQFMGIKDSTTNAEYADQVGQNLDTNTLVLVGNDSLLLDAMQAGASGCITAIANLHSPTLRLIWTSVVKGQPDYAASEFIKSQQKLLSSYRPYPATMKVLLSEFFGFPLWSVRSPLTPMPPDQRSLLIDSLREILDASSP